MLEVNNLTIQYGSREAAVKNVSFSVKKGETLAIVGESGSGKSTLISAIEGLLPGNGKLIKGSLTFDGKNLLTLNSGDWLKIRGTDMVIIPQDCGGTLNPIRKIGSQYIEYIQAHSKISGSEAEALAISLLKKVKLHNPENIMESYPHQLSGGMKQRVGIAMAITFKPKLMLADEPTSALDVTTQAQIINELMKLREENSTSMIMVTHNISVAAYVADYIIVLQNGKIVEQGSRDKIINHAEAAYTRELLRSVPGMDGERFV